MINITVALFAQPGTTLTRPICKDVDRNPSLAEPLMQLHDGRNIRSSRVLRTGHLKHDSDATPIARAGDRTFDALRSRSTRPSLHNRDSELPPNPWTPSVGAMMHLEVSDGEASIFSRVQA